MIRRFLAALLLVGAGTLPVAADDPGLEVTALRERCIPAGITRAGEIPGATLWQVACAGDDSRVLFIRCVQRSCSVDGRPREVEDDLDSGHR